MRTIDEMIVGLMVMVALAGGLAIGSGMGVGENVRWDGDEYVVLPGTSGSVLFGNGIVVEVVSNAGPDAFHCKFDDGGILVSCSNKAVFSVTVDPDDGRSVVGIVSNVSTLSVANINPWLVTNAVINEAFVWLYRVMVTGVYDGDTFTGDVELGMGVWLKGEKFRLYGIDAPELRGETKYKGELSRDVLRSMIDGMEVVVRSVKDKKGKYGRRLAVVYVASVSGGVTNWVNVNEVLVNDGYARRAEY